MWRMSRYNCAMRINVQRDSRERDSAYTFSIPRRVETRLVYSQTVHAKTKYICTAQSLCNFIYLLFRHIHNAIGILDEPFFRPAFAVLITPQQVQ